uniref:Major facilitator superfamily (MFS) profile domain-containing protein n=1 Tax=Panagrolaimus superbus TaxID=310955 RepID=A0A914YRP9_9BILA
MTGLESPEPRLEDQNGRTRFATRHQSHREMPDPENPDKWSSIKGCMSRARTWTRFLLVGITLLCLTSTWSNILAFNFVMVCTQSNEASPTTGDNGNDTIIPTHTIGPLKPVHFTTNQRTFLTSAVAVAALIANFIVTPAMGKFGTRTIFTVCGALSLIATAFMPLALRSGFTASIALRALQGIGFAASFPGRTLFSTFLYDIRTLQ